jgi:hypothetical protein
LTKQQPRLPDDGFDVEPEDITRLAWMVHTGDVRGVRRVLGELAEHGQLADVGAFALTASTVQLHITARWAQIDRQSGLSILQLAMRELNRRPRSAAAAEIVALLTAEMRVHRSVIRPNILRALRRIGLQANSALIVSDFLDGGERSGSGGLPEEEGASRSIVAGAEEKKSGQQH